MAYIISHWSYCDTFCRLFLRFLRFGLRKWRENMEKTVGQRIKECRLKLGMTQQEFAEVMYMPKSTISAYERNVVDLKLGTIKELANALHTTVGYLIEGEKEEFDADVICAAMMLQGMPEELRRVAVEQVKVLNGLER